MKKCVFIVPYFGKLPNYFPLFLRSCEYNKDYEWLILTDDKRNFNYPSNVKHIFFTFGDLKKRIQSKFKFQIHLDNVQKLCDYKPSYGLVFEDLIRNYRYWGYCDVDIIWGDINKFLPNNFEQFDKLFELGHCTIFKNTYENNRMFMKKIKGKSIYKWSYTRDDVTTFDEVYGDNLDVNDIFLSYGKRVFRTNYAFDVQPALIGFQNANYDFKSGTYLYEKNYWNKLCIWKRGKILRLSLKNNEMKYDEYMYIHLQDRKMGWSQECLKNNIWKIVPEYIKPIDFSRINVNEFRSILKVNIDLNSLIYFCNRLLAKIKHSLLHL